jgi:uncharacterized cofD-like protein
MGPGSLYTSIIPNLLVKGMDEAINASPAIKIYVCNIMTQHGETDGYRASDHLKALLNNSGLKRIDYCLLNNSGIPEAARERYGRQKAFQVEPDADNIKELGSTVIEDNVVSVEDYIRHNPKMLAKNIVDIISIAKTEAAHKQST